MATAVQPVFEYVLMNWPDVEAGRGRLGSAADALHEAAKRVDAVYARYQRAVSSWRPATQPAQKGR